MVKILLALMRVPVCPLKLDSSVWAAVCESQASAEFIQVNQQMLNHSNHQMDPGVLVGDYWDSLSARGADSSTGCVSCWPMSLMDD